MSMIPLKDLLVTQHGLRHPHPVLRQMVRYVAQGGFWTVDRLAQHLTAFSLPRPSSLIELVRVEDGNCYVHNGHHRCAATWLGGRNYLRSDEYQRHERSYAWYLESNPESGYFLTFDPRIHVRKADFLSLQREAQIRFKADRVTGETWREMQVEGYVLREWPRLSDKTGGCIDAYVMNLLEKFVHGSVRELVASGVSNISPADLDRHKLIVVDLPTLVGREPYQFVGMAWRLSTQRHAVRRPITPDTLDLVLWCDEAHLHALPSVDSMVQAVARSHKLIQVAITQNIPLLESVLKRREDVFAWLSNLHTWFMFANADRDTNEVCSARCGQSKQMMGGSSVNMGHADPFDDWMSTQQPQVSYSMQEHWLPDVRPEYWSGGQMRKGGSEGNFVVDVVIHQTGRKFTNGKPWIKTAFKQMV